MVRWFLPLVAALALAGCKKAEVKEIAVAEAAARFAANEATPEYREGAGWVPGAVLLTDFHEYPLSELPADKDRLLVFYCTSRM